MEFDYLATSRQPRIEARICGREPTTPNDINPMEYHAFLYSRSTLLSPEYPEILREALQVC